MVGEVQLNGVGVVIGLVRSRGGLGLLTWLPSLLAFSYPFPIPQSPLQLSNPPHYSPQMGWGLAVCVCGGLWLRDEQENLKRTQVDCFRT